MSDSVKPKVVFTFVEAGMGHIMPMVAIRKAFAEKYGGKCEVQSLYPFLDSKYEEVREMGKELASYTKSTSQCEFLHKLESFTDIFPSKLVLKFLDLHFGRKRKLYLEEYKDLKPDVLVSSYYLPSHLASQSNKRGDWNSYIVSYAPDFCTYPAWDRNCDLYFVYNDEAESESLKRGFKRERVKRIPYVLKDGLEDIVKTKDELKKEFGLDNGKPVVIYANGAYGTSSVGKSVRELIDSQINMNLVVMCGKNEVLFNEMNELCEQDNGNVTLKVIGFTDRMGEYMKAGDICIGKGSANSVQECLYVGTPFIMNSSANKTEDRCIRHHAKYNLAIKAFKTKKVIEILKNIEKDRNYYQYTIDNFNEKFRTIGGAESAADSIYELLKTRFPNL